MADYASSLPIRTVQPGDVAMQLVDSEQPSRSLKVNADGSINVVGNLSVTVDNPSSPSGSARDGSIFTKQFDKLVVLSKTNEGEPLQIKSQRNNIDVQLVTITYDADGDLQSIEVSDY